MTMVLVHGAWSTGAVWDAVRAHLPGQVLAPTLPGCGTHGDPTVGLATMVDALAELIEPLQDVTLVGHSWSGLVTWLAAARSTRVSRLLLIGAFEPVEGASLVDAFDDTQRRAELASIDGNAGWWPPPTSDEILASSPLTPTTAQIIVAGLTPHPGASVTEPVTGPVELDPTRVARLEPGGRDLDPGHWPMITAPGALAAWIHRHADT